MSKSLFTLPAKVKPVSAATAKVYKTYLNRLAAFDITSVGDILARPVEVNEVIEILASVEDDIEQKKQQARIYYSAVFYVLYENPFLEDPQNVLRLGFQRYRPKTTTSGEKWLPVDKYKKLK
jgi:hypothetical protein